MQVAFLQSSTKSTHVELFRRSAVPALRRNGSYLLTSNGNKVLVSISSPKFVPRPTGC